MPPANLMLRFIIGIPLLLGIIMISVVGFQVIEPVYNSTSEDFNGSEAGFGESVTTTNENAIMSFASLSMAVLGLVILAWVVVGDLSSDVNQGLRRR